MNECQTGINYGFAGAISQAMTNGCFPACATALKRGKGHVSMDEIKVGDEVLCISPDGSLGFEPVVAFAHLLRASRGFAFDFVEVSIDDTLASLFIHPDHMLLLKKANSCTADYVAASTVEPGDLVSCVWFDGTVIERRVERVGNVSQKGLYCPITRSGTIVVNGVVCSCYAPPTKSLGFSVPHRTAHAAMAPVRLQYAVTGQGFDKEGINPICQFLLAAFN